VSGTLSQSEMCALVLTVFDDCYVHRSRAGNCLSHRHRRLYTPKKYAKKNGRGIPLHTWVSIMSVYTACVGRCCSRVSLVRCLHHARRCRSTLSHYLESPGSQTSKDMEESTDHYPFTEDTASDGDETNSSTDDIVGDSNGVEELSCAPHPQQEEQGRDVE